MAYTETTTTGYGTRVGNSFKSIGTGFVLLVAATACCGGTRDVQ